jgi:hypothetical protein
MGFPIAIATLERRTLLRAIAAASGTALASTLLPRHVAAQPASSAAAADSGDFEPAEIKTADDAALAIATTNSSLLTWPLSR